jgi:hypothetical protein
MSTSFFIMGEDYAAMFDPVILREAVLARWPGTTWQERDFGADRFSHMWVIPRPPRDIEFMLATDQKAVTLDGDLDDTVTFALWLRPIVGRDLIVFDEQNTAIVPVRSDTTEEDIVRPFTSVWDNDRMSPSADSKP